LRSVFSTIYGTFRPTWSNSGNTHNTRNPWDEISNKKLRKRNEISYSNNCF